jgi:hypothetical protein
VYAQLTGNPGLAAVARPVFEAETFDLSQPLPYAILLEPVVPATSA